MQLLCDQEHTDGAVLGRAAGMGSGSGGPGGPRGLSVAPWNFTEWDTRRGTRGEWGAGVRARAGSWGVRACERDGVC